MRVEVVYPSPQSPNHNLVVPSGYFAMIYPCKAFNSNRVAAQAVCPELLSVVLETMQMQQLVHRADDNLEK